MSGQESTAARPSNDARALRIAHWCSIIYISIYAFEAPIRYLLHFVHLGPIIVLRDGLIAGPLLLLGARGMFRRNMHPAFWVFGIAVAVADTVSTLNFGTFVPAVFGTKILLNVLFGLIAGSVLIVPTKNVTRYLFAIWAIAVVALVAEKFAISFPWVGMKETIGGVEVSISRDWQVADPGSKRVGGFTRSSISAATLICCLSLVIIFQMRHYLLRVGVILVNIGAVYLTTQKGALIGFVLVSLAACAPSKLRRSLLALLVIVGVVLEIGLPLYTNGLFMEQGHGGVFSGASFASRIVDTWPKSLEWIGKHETFPLGIGMGSIGAAQQPFDNAAQHYPDNTFLFAYSYFGVPSFLFFGLFVYAALKSARIDPKIAQPGLAVAACMLLYGIVVSIFEDQASALYAASGLGVLLSAQLLPNRSAASASDAWQRQPRQPQERQPIALAPNNNTPLA